LSRPEYIRENPSTVYIIRDNQGALALVKNPYLYKQSKYINICYYYIRDLAKKSKLDIIYILIVDIATDRFTKPLARIVFERFRSSLELVKK
jgi:hypothetical protein